MLLLIAGLAPRPAAAQNLDSLSAGATIDSTVEAGDPTPKRRFVKFNEYDGPISTLRFGYGFLVDYAAYSQDEESEAQMSPEDKFGLRDFRLLFKGRLKTDRPITWTLGYMWDANNDEWRFRQTGINVGVPEISSNFFLGRQKEGYSMVKVMVGYDGWTNERSTASDAFIPILADGLKWSGYLEKSRILWNLGAYSDLVGENESFATADNQVVARLGLQPILDEKKVLHLAAMTRVIQPDEGKLQPRSRPESYLGPYYIDTGKFDAESAIGYGVEAFYRSGSILFGGEYHFQDVDAPTVGDPTFHGGDVVFTWNITGETRPYNAPGGFFRGVSPTKSVFEGGPGAVEAVLRLSYTDLDAGTLRGGKFTRFTSMVNWHMADFLRLEAVYGIGKLERFDLEGTTQFLQFRMQTCL